jgi:TatA/E family protein of Tat protein translocase
MNTPFSLILAVFGLGMPEIIAITVLLVLLFGAKKLPELAKGMGKSIKEFKKATNEDEDEEAKASDKKSGSKTDTAKPNDPA